MKISSNKGMIILTAVLIAVFLLPMAVRAEEVDNSRDKPVSNTVDVTNDSELQSVKQSKEARLKAFQEKQALVKQKMELQRKQVETKLEARKLEVCKKHEESINNLMARISDRGDKRLGMFDKVIERVKTFYVTKGLNISNYEELVAAVDSAKVVAEAANESTLASSTTFKCDGTDPRGASLYFKEDLKTQIQAMKDYRLAIKNLIQAIRTANEATQQSDTQGDQ